MVSAAHAEVYQARNLLSRLLPLELFLVLSLWAMKIRPSPRIRRSETRRTPRVRVVDPRASPTVELAWLLPLTTEATRVAAPSDATTATEASLVTTRHVDVATRTATVTETSSRLKELLPPPPMLLRIPTRRRSAVSKRRSALLR